MQAITVERITFYILHAGLLLGGFWALYQVVALPAQEAWSSLSQAFSVASL